MRNCEYIKPNGEFCGSPAVRGRDYCYWHLTCVARRLRAEKQQATADNTPLELPPLEDANSIQVAIMTVIDAMLRNRIGPRMSGRLLYALQLASSNLKQGVCFQPGKQASGADQEAEAVTRCSSYDSLEEDYGIQEHAEQLTATNEADRFCDAGEAKEENRPEEKQPSEALQFLREKYGCDVEEFYTPGEDELVPWRAWKQRQSEEQKQHWENIRHDLAEAANSQDLEKLKDLLANCYERAGLHYEAEGWKPAGPQKVLFPRKPPASVQQQWFDQRQASCDAELNRLMEQEGARKKTS
jgi:hypothetical protein